MSKGLSRRALLRGFLGAAPALVAPALVTTPAVSLFTKLWNWYNQRKISETVGTFPLRQDITVLPADDPRKLRMGWVIYEEVGIVVVNDYAISNVVA